MVPGKSREIPAGAEDKINEIGFGLYQVHVFVLCAGVVVAESGGLQTSAALASAIMQDRTPTEYKVKGDLAQEAQMLSTYMGFALGTISSGFLGDYAGRRLPIFVAYLGMCCSVVGLYLMQTYASLCLWAAVLEYPSLGFCSFGFFGGLGIPAAFIALAEVCPSKLRGVTNAAMAFAFCFGDVWCALGFRILLPELVGKAWHGMLLWIGIPPFLLLAFGLISPVARLDTAHFLSARGQLESVKVLELMASMNDSGRVDLSAMAPEHEEKPVSVSDALQSLTSRENSLSVLALSVMFFVKDLAFYGMGAFLPLAWRKSSVLEGALPATELLCTALVGVPGVLVAMILIFSLPRRLAYAVAAGICAIGVYAVHGILDQQALFGVTGVVFYKLFYPTAQMITFLFPAEVFSTQIRVWSMSIIAFCGRMAPLAVPWIVHTSQHLFLFLTMGFFVLASLLVWSLPETKDTELKTLSPVATNTRVKAGSCCRGNVGS
ncbi:unnamed protein product [Cladocopium goreaui]|uniref:Solute carrier family 22 member 3 (Extraneuronal monoamine transporter) (EMT) (Organic cation transporter 3) (OCT3) n=1 Tax=Cladocopium goreaui TaxID=2562237 RepID=A0A9P1GR39_9DINO|nr:unnamed protein product [Cladocopium goreaui]